MTRHDAKRHVMAPGGPFMAENDSSWASVAACIRSLALNSKTSWRIDRGDEWNSEKTAGEGCGSFD
jgi:hypothetical protein